jgi:carbamoyltransferase
MLIWGISALSHDAALAVVDNDQVLFAAHAERYSRVKNDPFLNSGILTAAARYGRPDAIAWYERPLLKKVRHLRARQWRNVTDRADLPARYLKTLDAPFRLPEPTFLGHHESHAAAGYATSPFTDCAVIVADAIGEFDTFTVGRYDGGGRLHVLHRQRYPHSLGLLYSAFTRRCGFKPNEDEYIIMGMAAFGEPRYADAIREAWIDPSPPSFRLRANVHRGIGQWLPDARREDLAASVQLVTEEVMLGAARWARAHTGCADLVLMGGVALNCVANARIARTGLFDRLWIFPNPGDAGSSLGAAAALSGRKLGWRGPYLGTDIDRPRQTDELVKTLATTGIAAVANGRAEFGPRALGNRSLLADPRPADMKDRVNQVKGRERFRPFAPVIRQERAAEFFDLPLPASPYMQYTAPCREPDRFPAIAHVDGASRVQTVTREEHPGMYDLLTAWEEATGCPMLLNTSLNSRGEPLVDTWDDALRFSHRENIPLY